MLTKRSGCWFPVEIDWSHFCSTKIDFLEYPKIVEQHEIRSSKRVKCTLPVTLIIKNKKFRGTMLDISEQGCRCLTNAAKDIKLLSINKEDQISLRCKFPGVYDEQIVLGNAKNIRMDRQELTLGIQFQEMESGVKGIIDHYIASIEEFF